MELKTKDAKEMAKGVGMTLFVNEECGTARLYYDNLDIPDELDWVEAVLKIFIRQNPTLTITAMTEIHERLTGKTLRSKIRNLFRKSNPIGGIDCLQRGIRKH